MQRVLTLHSMALALALQLSACATEPVPTSSEASPEAASSQAAFAELVDAGLLESWHPAPKGIDENVVLPAHALPGEKAEPGKADQYWDFRLANPQWYAITETPQGSFKPMVEWEEMSHVFITYTDGINSSTNAAEAMAEIISNTVLYSGAKGGVVYNSSTAKNQLTTRLKNDGMTTGIINASVDWHQIPNDTIWMIDYGPVPMIGNGNTMAFADFRYYNQLDEHVDLFCQKGSFSKKRRRRRHPL